MLAMMRGTLLLLTLILPSALAASHIDGAKESGSGVNQLRHLEAHSAKEKVSASEDFNMFIEDFTSEEDEALGDFVSGSADDTSPDQQDSNESEQDDIIHTVPGDAAWLGEGKMVDDAPVEFEKYLPLLYVIMGGPTASEKDSSSEAVAIPRVIVRPNQRCPDLHLLPTTSGVSIPQVTLRGVGDMELPHAFPIKVCETRLETKAQKKAWSDGHLAFRGLEDRDPIKIPTNPKRTLLIADTGLRVKATNLGLGKCEGNKLYGIPQCAKNFSASDVNQVAEGDFQSLDDWPLPDLMEHAADTNPDLVTIMGDYLYRQSPCPANNTVNADCADINMPPNFAHTDIPYGTIINFVPGHWGDNWFGWWADFFFPALPLLAAAPLIAVRGNHENCARAGYGYFFLMSQFPYDGTDGGSWCPDYSPPFAVPFEKDQFLVLDDSIISPKDGGIDHMNFTEGACPGPPDDGSVIVPKQQNRWDDPDQTSEEIEEQLNNFTLQWEEIKELSQSHDTNFYLAHRPLFAVACNGNEMDTLDWTMQQTLQKDTLDRVVAMITGHMHWLEVLSFVDQSLPAQLVVGHGGTDRIPNYVNQDIFPSLQLEVGQPDGTSNLYTGRVDKGMTDSRMYGFAVMEQSTETGDYNVKFLSLNHTVSENKNVRELVELSFQLDIPKGPRVVSSSSSSSSSDDADAQTGDILQQSLYDARSGPSPPEKVKISIQPAYHGIPVYLGIELGLYEAMGLDVDISVWNSGGPQVAAAAEEGAWDFGVAGSVPSIIAASKGISTVGISNDESSVNQVVGGPGVAEFPPYAGELSDAALAVTHGSTADLILRKCMEVHGVRFDDSILLGGSPNVVVAALESGNSLYGGLWAPNLYEYLTENPDAKGWCNAEDVGITIPGGLMIRDEWGEENPILAAKTLAVYLHGVGLMQNLEIRDRILEHARGFYDYVGLSPSDEDIERDFLTRPTYGLDALLGMMDRNFVNDNVSKLDDIYNSLAVFLEEQGTIEEVPDPKSYLNDQYLQMISANADMRSFAYAGYTASTLSEGDSVTED